MIAYSEGLLWVKLHSRVFSCCHQISSCQLVLFHDALMCSLPTPARNQGLTQFLCINLHHINLVNRQKMTPLFTDTRFVVSIIQEAHASHTIGTCTKLDKSNICVLQLHRTIIHQYSNSITHKYPNTEKALIFDTVALIIDHFQQAQCLNLRQ